MLQLRPAPIDHPDAAALITRLQAHYQAIYGGEDRTPIDVPGFSPPLGYFVVGYVDDAAVACGGWRRVDDGEPPLRAGDAEIKRMYVEPAHRGRGVARSLLADLEWAAARAGRTRLVLETGVRQPDAIALYRRAGYRAMAPFGFYRDAEQSRYFAKLVSGVTATDGG